jgi:uncharacterized HAD superfamily protein
LNIGIDIDNTITNTREVILRHLGVFARDHNLSSHITPGRYGLEESLSWDSRELTKFLRDHLGDIYREVTPKPHAVEVIAYLHLHHSITLITSRNQRDESIEAITLEWLKIHSLPYNKLVMNQTENMHHFSKLQPCRDNKINLMIEDHHDLSLELSSIIPVLMFDYPYNSHLKGHNIVRVKDWLEVKSYFDKP